MYILAGEKKGTILDVPKEGTRPTTNKIKKSLFDTIQHEIEGARVLDLFAGSGNLGLEALSRGAIHATFVEKSAKAAVSIKKNIEKLGYADRTTLLIRPAEKILDEVASYNLIFMDPPYDIDVIEFATQILENLSPKSLFIVEQSKRTPFPLPFTKKKEYGDTILYFFAS